MADQLPAIVVLAPLLGALLVGLIRSPKHRICFPIAFASLLTSLLAAVAVLKKAAATGPVEYFVGGWSDPVGIGIELRIDTINGLVLVVIATVACLVSIFSIRRAGEENVEKTAQYFTLFLLLCVGLFGMTITGDAFNLYVLVEITSLTSYALVAMGASRRGTHAAFNYIIMGTIGASFYLLGVGYLYMRTGALNMRAIHELLAQPEIALSHTVMVAFILIMVGLWTKMAFFPLYGWLPNAYSYCPSSSGSILAPLVTKVSVYVMIRVMLGVFGPAWVFEGPVFSNSVVWLAVIAIVAGSTLALGQRELKRMLCFLIVAEVGYMVGGAWLANHWGMVGAVYHIISDAFMTLCVFIGAGILIKRTGSFRIEDLDGIFRKMPVTMTGFTVGALAMIGVPPTCGFFSKWYLIRGGLESGHYEYVIALIFSSLVNAVLFFRIFEIAYFGKNPAETHGHGDHEGETQQGQVADQTGSIAEARLSTLIPLLASAILIILIGVFNGEIVALIRQSFEGMPVIGPPGGGN